MTSYPLPVPLKWTRTYTATVCAITLSVLWKLSYFIEAPCVHYYWRALVTGIWAGCVMLHMTSCNNRRISGYTRSYGLILTVSVLYPGSPFFERWTSIRFMWPKKPALQPFWGTIMTELWLHATCCSRIKGFNNLIRPPVRSNGRSYKMLVMFFFYFATRSPRSLGRSPWNLATWSKTVWIL